MSKRLKVIGKYLFTSIVSILVLLFILPYLFPSTIEKHIKIWVNQTIEAELDFERSKLSFFKHFPSLTLSLEDVILKGAKPFENDTLVAAKDLSFGINLFQLAKGNININQVFLEDGRVEVLVNQEGYPNYNIFKSDTTQSTSTDTTNTELRLENIVLNNIHLTYVDQTIPMVFSAKRLDYKGSGDISSEEFELASRLRIDSALFNFDGTYYIKNQSLGAKLNTRINTKSLEIEFKENGFKLNDLPVRFNARIVFLADGYDFDIDVKTRKSSFENLLSAIPQTMGEWIDKTKVKGDTQIDFKLNGKYIPSQNLFPDIFTKAHIYKGYIKYPGAPLPVQDIDLRFQMNLPSLDPNQMEISVDTLLAKLGSDQFKANLQTKGFNHLAINGNLTAQMQLEQWMAALGIQSIDLKGNYNASLALNGNYVYGVDTNSLRKNEKILSIPNFEYQSTFKNGFVKFKELNQSIKDIQFDFNASNTTSDWRDIKLNLDNLNATALNSLIHGYLHLNNDNESPVDVSLKSSFSLKEFQEFVPLDSTLIDGLLNLDIVSKGDLDIENKIFPVTNASLKISNGFIQTKYYPTPIQNIQVEVDAVDEKGSLNDLKVNIKPISFELAGLPFFIKANFENFDDIHYDIISKGKLDIGTLYKVFQIDGYNINGQIDTDFFMKGKSSDLINGRFNNIQSRGKLQVKDIYVQTEILPKSLHLYEGVFTFNREKMMFNNFRAKYASSDLVLNGYFLNMLNWFLLPNQQLKGSFTLHTPMLNVNEWMVFSDEPISDTLETAAPMSGVVMLPHDMDLSFKAKADKIIFNDILLSNFNGDVTLKNSILSLNNTQFNLAGATISMDGSYASKNPHSAIFDYAVKADSFDIQKGYKSIPIFRELAPAAKNAFGLIGLDYKIAGHLGADMYPQMNTLKGGGTISVKDVKLLGFKLMNSVSKSLENENLKDPKLNGIKIVSTIENSILTIEPVRMRIAGFRPRFQGQMSLDGRLQMKGRIGLPPLGIFGIPFNISGTSENPIVQFKRGPDNKPLTEKDESDLDDEDRKILDSTLIAPPVIDSTNLK